MRQLCFFMVSVVYLFSTSCSKDENLHLTKEVIEAVKIKTAIAKLGFDTTQIVVKGDEIFVEDDIVLRKSQLFKAVPRQAVISPNEGASGYRLQPFKYCISTTLTNHGPVQEAMDAFKAILPSILAVTRVFNEAEADLVIRGYYEVSNSCGYAEWPTISWFPTGLYPPFALYVGNFVNINLYQWANLSNSQRKALISHELGHAFGIRHTNWRENGESENFQPQPGGGSIIYGAYTVPNTNNTSLNPDPSSIFNAKNCGRSWGSGFTTNDARAIVYIATGAAF